MLSSASSRPDVPSLALLAPRHASIPNSLANVVVDAERHTDLTAAIQRLRGAVYLEDGAIRADQLAADGRHVQAADEASWHVVSLDGDGHVRACARYRPYAPSVAPEDLGVWQSALARDAHWGETLRAAVAAEIERARVLGLAYVEVGGWAVCRQRRGTPHAFETAVASYALARALGDCIGITTATVRHCSARVLRKLGGRSLVASGVELPAYFDPLYGCVMEMLGFDSRVLNRRYGAHIDRVFARFAHVPVIAPGPTAAAQVEAPRSIVAAMASLADRLPHFASPDALPGAA